MLSLSMRKIPAIRQMLAPAAVGAVLFCGGCASSSGMRAIPASADITASGNNKLSYTFPRDGMVYVYDKNDDSVLYSGRVLGRDEVLVDPDANQIRINNRVVHESGVDRGHQVQVRFAPSESGDHTVIQKETVIERRVE